MKGIRSGKKAIDQTRGPIAWPFLSHRQPKSFETKKDSTSDPIPNVNLNLNIMSFNIRRGTARDGRNRWIYRANLVHEVLDQYRPDVLGLQEALDFQISEIREMLPGYKHVGIGNLGRSRGLHNAIFYDADRFALAEQGTFWLSDTPDIPRSRGWGNILPRICTWVRLIDKESRQAFYFYNTHLDHLSQRSRKKSVILLIQRIYGRPFEDPFILTGDFNARERSRPVQYLKGNITLKMKTKSTVLNPVPLVDTFRVRYPNKRNTVTFHGFRKYFFRFRLDYIFVPPSVRVLDATIIQLKWKKRYPSDHFPLFAHIDLPVSCVSSDCYSPFEEAVNH
jgi:endonuclease/exonuclease/phosphatase family metal-dependent hydrolase